MIDAMLMNSTYGTISSIEQHEPFNPRLWERAKDLARQEEDLIEEIASLRRDVPGVVVENAKRVYKGGMEEDERVLGGRLEVVRERDGEGSGLGVGGLERGNEVEGAWRRGVQGLEGLKGSLPEMVAKAERARKAEEYVLSKGSN